MICTFTLAFSCTRVRRHRRNPGAICEGVGTGQAGDKSEGWQFQQDTLQLCCMAAAVWARLGCDRIDVAGKPAIVQSITEQAELCRVFADPPLTAKAPATSERTPDSLFQVLFAVTQCREIQAYTSAQIEHLGAICACQLSFEHICSFNHTERIVNI